MKARLAKIGQKEVLTIDYVDEYQDQESQCSIAIPLSGDNNMVTVTMTREALFDLVNIINNRSIR